MTRGRIAAIVVGVLAVLCAFPVACATAFLPHPETIETTETLGRSPEKRFDELRTDAPPPNEFRAVCDRERTKAAIVEALRN